MIVGVVSDGPTATVTYRGNSVPSLGAVVGTNCKVQLFGAVPTGSGSTLQVNMSGTANVLVQAFTFFNVNGSSLETYTTNTGTVTPMSVSVASHKAEVVFDFGCNQGTSPTMTIPNNSSPHPIVVSLSKGAITSAIVAGGSFRSSGENAATTTAVSYVIGGTSLHWAIAGIALKPASGSAIRLDHFAAYTAGDDVDLRWRTGSEISNVGFNVYRDDGQSRFRINERPILGAALLTGAGISLAAGQRYGFRDVLNPGSAPAARYWLEDIDVNGSRTMHGPIIPLAEAPPSPPARTPASPSSSGSALPTSLVTTLAVVPAPFVPPEAPLSTPAFLTGDSHSDSTLAETQWRLAAGNAIKIGVNRTGWYELTGAALVAAGLSPATDPRQLSLLLEGREVPIEVRGGETGGLADDDTVGFFGQAINASSTDTRVYWLTDQLGARARIQPVMGDAPAAGSPSADVPFVVEWRPRSLYFGALVNGEGDNFFGPLVGGDPITRHIDLPGRMPAGRVTVEAGVQGVSLTPHAVSIEVGGQSLGQIILANQDRRSVQLTVPEPAITDSGVDVVFRASDATDLTLVDFVRASYQRTAAVVGGQAQFSLDAGTAVSVGGFAPRESVQVLDVTDAAAPHLISTAAADDQGQVLVAATPVASRALLIRSQQQTTPPAYVVSNQASRLYDSGNRGELLVIGPGELLPAFEPLRRLRESQGWTVKLADVQDVYDEFAFGTKHPAALRALMTRARQWARPPRALILLGDATFDPRDFLAQGAMDRVPTKLVDTYQMETASDDWFTDFDGDGIADLPVGRLPARTLADATTMIGKLVEAPLFLSSAEAANAVPALFVADSPDSDYDFPAIAGDVSNAVAPPWKTVSFRRGGAGMTAAALHSLMQTRPAFIGYHGHGSQELWAGDLLGNDLNAELGTRGPSAFWMDLTCLNGFFQDVYKPSLAEQLLRRPEAGAFGVWASSGVTEEVYWQKQLGQTFVDQLWNHGATVGEAAIRAKQQVPDLDIRRSWILFGDPTWQPAPFLAATISASPDGGDVEAGAGNEGPDAAAGLAPVSRTSTGCACVMAGQNAGNPGISVAAIVLALGVAQRRRRRGRSSQVDALAVLVQVLLEPLGQEVDKSPDA
ncbi:MAG TPA: C25 family cysteine peptidase [Polyangia bacterium]|nr:C25 family cysteine peptidase [Polyangia bacterium]